MQEYHDEIGALWCPICSFCSLFCTVLALKKDVSFRCSAWRDKQLDFQREESGTCGFIILEAVSQTFASSDSFGFDR